MIALIALSIALVLPGSAGGQTSSGPLNGSVRSSAGEPLPSVRVVVRQGPRAETAVTDASGAFSFPAVAFPARLEISAAGFLTLQTTIASSPLEVVLFPASVHESVVVSEGRAGAPYLPAAGLLHRADLDALPAVTPDEALRAVAGFSLFRRSAARASNPTTHGVTMRGLSASGASRGLVLLEGVPLNDGFGGWVTWTRVPPQALDEIEIDRGAAGDTFGSDALGGVFNLKAGTGAARLPRAGVEGGSNGLVSVDASAGGRLGALSLFGAGTWFRTDGVIPVAPESRGPVDTRADADWFNGFAKAAADGRAGRLVISAWGGRDDRGNGTPVQRNHMSGGTFAAAFSRTAAATHIAARASISPNSFDQTFSSVAAGRAAETLTSSQSIESDVARGIVELTRGVPRGIVIARASLSRASADFVDVRPASTQAQALRDDGEAVSMHAGFTPTGRISLGGGVRHEWRAAPAGDTGRDTATIGHASASWQPSDMVAVRGSVASSHRWPTLNELVRNFQVGSVLTLANPALGPERARSADVTVTITCRRWTASGTLFSTVVHDAIANVTQTTTRRQRQNAGDARATGLELEAGVRPIDALRVRASVTFTDATFQDSLEPVLNGKRLPQVPRAAVSVAADAVLPRQVRASALWRSTSSQFDDDRNVFELEPASQIDLRLAGRLSRFGWHITLENAFDSRVEVGRTPLVTLAGGRAVRVGISLSLLMRE